MKKKYSEEYKKTTQKIQYKIKNLVAELVLGSKTVFSEELMSTGKVLSGAEASQGLCMETGELLWRGRMRALNPDLYFCKLEANFASFCPALSSSSPFKH